MYKFIYKKWWKYLAVIILLYVFFVGFWIPLKPGILSISERQFVAGDPIDVTIRAYNADYKKEELISAYLSYDTDHVYALTNVSVVDRNTLKISGSTPLWRSNKEADYGEVTLIVHDPSSGFQVLPSAMAVSWKGGEEETNVAWAEYLPNEGTEWKFQFPFRVILYETIRNVFFHVAIWMAMFVLLIVSLIYSIKYLRSNDLIHDAVAASFAHVAVLLGAIGMITGSIWARYTWGTFWTSDPKLNMSAVAMMIYLAYSILRSSISNDDQRAKLGAAYNIFAFVAMIPLIFIIPRLTSSLHPGNGGNPALGGEDLDSTLRLVFYPAIIGYTLLGVWLSSLLFRLRKIQLQQILKQLQK